MENNNPRRFRSAERHLRALELRKAGMPYADIARTLGYRDASGAYRAVEMALQKSLREPANEVRNLELERLDVVLMVLWARMKQGDLDAVDKVLKVMERRAKLLGLDAPTKQETDIGDALGAILERLAHQSGATND